MKSDEVRWRNGWIYNKIWPCHCDPPIYSTKKLGEKYLGKTGGSKEWGPKYSDVEVKEAKNWIINTSRKVEEFRENYPIPCRWL